MKGHNNIETDWDSVLTELQERGTVKLKFPPTVNHNNKSTAAYAAARRLGVRVSIQSRGQEMTLTLKDAKNV